MQLAKTSSIVYGILRPIIRLGANVFLRRRGISGVKNFPKDKPTILIANHQNAMLDPVLICIYVPKQIHWLTRADVFKNSIVKKILHSFNMLPVYRERDGVGNMRDENVKIFQECFNRLDGKAVISMFPEGTHRGKKQLITFKKGLSRMAFGAMDKHSNLDDLVVLPIGLDYSDFSNYHPEFNLKIGEPIAVLPFYEIYKKDQVQGIQELQKATTEALSALMIDVKNEELYEAIIQLRGLIFHLSSKKSLKEQFDFYNFISKKMETTSFSKKEVETLNLYSQQLKELGLNEEYRTNNSHRLLLFGFIALFAPIYIAARVVFMPFEKFVEGFVAKNIKDDLFKNSIRMSFWTFLIPPYLGIIGIAVKVVSGCSWIEWMIGLLILIGAGLTGIQWIRSYRKWQGSRQWKKEQMNMSDHFKAFSQNREQTIKIIQDLIK